MGSRQSRIQSAIIDPEKFGVSFSLKQCRNFQLGQKEALLFLIQKLGFRRFRLMSYWDEHEAVRGKYNFSQLDEQIRLIEKSGGMITLCLGVRQPRWPESHWPQWALVLPQEERYQALYNYIQTVVERYKTKNCIVSYQLENEALNRSFGLNGDFSRKRLRHEYQLVRKIDPSRPIIMSTSNTYGLPIRAPKPDIFGFTFYQTQFKDGAYSRSRLPMWWFALRAKLIRITRFRPSFIHELQAEPWGPNAIWEMPVSEQDKSMDAAQLKINIQLAKNTRLYPIDLWGSEWWYWRYKKGDVDITQTVQDNLTSDDG